VVESVRGSFKAPPQHSAASTEENNGILSLNKRFSSQYSYLRIYKYEAGVLTTSPRRFLSIGSSTVHFWNEL
jgi:hypothetical protein